MAKYTFKQFQTIYPDDAHCLAKLMEVNYGGTEIMCPGCGVDTKFHPLSKRRAYVCQHCGHHVYPCAGTIFHKSPTNLTKWFFVMYLMTSTRHGVAAKEVERQLGVTYKCAWRMCHEIRKLMASADYAGPLSGHIEIDETLVGGKSSRRNLRANKTVVFGMVERDERDDGGNKTKRGKIRVGPVPDETKFTLEPIILENVLPDTIISTDEHPSYGDLKLTYQHGTVEHGAKEYVRGIHHVNSLEGHWSLFKRAVKGTHVHISAKHAWKYINEFSYRRNMRHSHSAMFDLLIHSLALPRLQEP